MPKCDFNKVAKQLYFITLLRHMCSPVNLLHIFRTPFSKEHLWMAVSDGSKIAVTTDGFVLRNPYMQCSYLIPTIPEGLTEISNLQPSVCVTILTIVCNIKSC